jgi:UDP-N-acetylmuramate dehydrogenase
MVASDTLAIDIQDHVPLAPRCTLELGGPARHYLRPGSEEEVRAGLRFAIDRRLAVGVLGGGSNLVIADRGFPGLVIDTGGLRGRRLVEAGGDEVHLCAAAGEPWDELVAFSVEQGLAGLECLSGIPGSCGATPIQNVGAYGQEVADVLRSVRVMDTVSLEVSELSAAACGFGYRESRFKREPGRHVVLAVTFALRRGGAPTLRYQELVSALAKAGGTPDLAAVRRAVLGLRRGKSMVIDPLDENRRSVGSFFMNPVLGEAEAEAVARRAVALGVVGEGAEVPRYPAGPGQVKLAAGWLIERAGLRRGARRGAFGISPKHALALVHYGGGRTEELVAFAGEVRGRVRERFGVVLRPEPVAWGFDWGAEG